FEPAYTAVRRENAVFDVEVLAVLNRLLNGGLDALTVLGVRLSHHRLKGSREGTRPQAVDHFEVRRPDHTSSLKGPFPGSHGAGFEREPQALLALAQRALRLLLLGDIFHQYDHSPNVAMLRHVG